MRIDTFTVPLCEKRFKEANTKFIIGWKNNPTVIQVKLSMHP